MASISSLIPPVRPVIDLPLPSPEQWELIREFVTKFWYEGDQNIDDVINQIQAGYGVKVTYVVFSELFRELTIQSQISQFETE